MLHLATIIFEKGAVRTVSRSNTRVEIQGSKDPGPVRHHLLGDGLMSNFESPWGPTGPRPIENGTPRDEDAISNDRNIQLETYNQIEPWQDGENRNQNLRMPAEPSRHDAARKDKEALRLDRLTRTIESEIIPRLLLAHLANKSMRPGASEQPIAAPQIFFGQQRIIEFSEIVVKYPMRSAIQYVDRLIADGMSIEVVILDVLSPTARHLGLQWETDELSFVDVTLGLSHLQQLLRIYSPALVAEVQPRGEGRRMFLSAMPGEQHTFGLSVVEEFFRRDGWDVVCETAATRRELIARPREEWFDVVGLSASGDAAVALLPQLIRSIRDVSLNREVRVIVGGCAFLANPDNALALGADLGAANGRDAVSHVDLLLKRASIA